jgi:hypothetical protein
MVFAFANMQEVVVGDFNIEFILVAILIFLIIRFPFKLLKQIRNLILDHQNCVKLSINIIEYSS